jgi:hypothetical protein
MGWRSKTEHLQGLQLLQAPASFSSAKILRICAEWGRKREVRESSEVQGLVLSFESFPKALRPLAKNGLGILHGI